MAKVCRTIQPQWKQDAPVPTSIACTPKLYWPRCYEHQSKRTVSISRHEKFPFEFLYKIGVSTAAYPKEHHLVDEDFLRELCGSKVVIIIQKTFDLKHYKAIIDVMNKYADEQILQTKRLVIISKSTLGAKCAGTKGTFHVMFNDALFTKTSCDFHDRIVILDGKIWHFGATVCGMHNTPNAYSGPWTDKDSSFMNFITSFVKI